MQDLTRFKSRLRLEFRRWRHTIRELGREPSRLAGLWTEIARRARCRHPLKSGGSFVTTAELNGIIAFLQSAEQLKNTLRSGRTSTGRPESTAEHSWRLCLMAMLFASEFPTADFARLIRICVIHDLGEALRGDIPAIDQSSAAPKALQEREDLLQLVAPLPDRLGNEIVSLWDEYEAATTLEARLAKALDKLETILQHNQGLNRPDFNYRFNLEYGTSSTNCHPLMAAFRAIVDEQTRRRADESLSRSE